MSDRTCGEMSCNECNDLREKLEAEILELRRLAQAVVDRWDSPLWKDIPHTAEYINALREVLR